ncbi:hypothetical protein EB796_015800 [Bugula neritina]|uniref:Uncharacterized protein n=1 Tax=Bugula neritina TaxID=10212 RepID=A0A7J7JJU2_BUGNE|nr:hypothetical protein EB796_015800 [Bugula neritina]
MTLGSETGGDAGLSPFDENLDGNSGYQVFSQQLIPGTSNYRYALVYEFDTNNDISVPNDSDVPVFYTTDDSGSSEVIQDALVSRSCDLHCASFCSGQEKSDLSSTAVPTKANRQIIVIATCSGIVILILIIAVILLAVKKQGMPCQKPKDTEKETHVYLASGSQSSHSYMGTYSLPYGENRGDNLPMRDSGRQLADELPPLPAPFPPHRLSQTSSSSYYKPMQVTTGTPISTNDPVDELNTPSNERPLSVNSTYIIPNNPYSSTPSEEKPTPIPRKTTIRSSNEDSVNNEQQPSVDEAD